MSSDFALGPVLDHYDVQYKPDRMKQMVSCPLHDDRTPSLSINLTENLWRCHSCGKAGDGYTMIMEKEGTNFVGARAIATANGFTAGSAGGSDDLIPGSAYGGRGGRRVPSRKGDRPGNGAYVPRWRR